MLVLGNINFKGCINTISLWQVECNVPATRDSRHTLAATAGTYQQALLCQLKTSFKHHHHNNVKRERYKLICNTQTSCL